MSDDETRDPRLTVNGKRHGGGMTNLMNVETHERCAYVSIHSANKATAKKLGFRWCKGKGDHGKGMWYIREDAETDMKVWAAEQLTPRPREGWCKAAIHPPLPFNTLTCPPQHGSSL